MLTVASFSAFLGLTLLNRTRFKKVMQTRGDLATSKRGAGFGFRRASNPNLRHALTWPL
ncbi:hypothetical protein ABAC402_00650 [Asticcacaulis sp. AC402]|nr:hypothetical protein ABAC402_00650 [Asticcacaulis sp. AC402]